MNKKPTTFDMPYEKFIGVLEEDAFYEAMYEDSEGRTILVIRPLSLFSFINKLLAEHRDE
jgi:hypothetical protein